MKVIHVITGLGQGGAEGMLCKLISATGGAGLRHAVVSLTDGGVFGDRLSADGIPVTCLRMKRGVPNPLAIVRLAALLTRERPDLVQAWMYHANLLAGIAGSASRIPVVWGIHHSDVDSHNTKRITHWTRAVCARLSGVLPARIVCCAESALQSHRALGYRADRMVVIPNGFELESFNANACAGAHFRRDLSIPEDAPAIGLVARFHPDKDHRTFLAAARIVAEKKRDATFVLVGNGVEWSNRALSAIIHDLGLRPRVRLVGVRQDIPAVLSALDVLASSSRSEGFPQVLGEAMLCGVPCAVTDCGDSKAIVGPTGRVVPPRDPKALADAILYLLGLAADARAELTAKARERIRQRYDIRVVAKRYAALYAEVASAQGVPGC